MSIRKFLIHTALIFSLMPLQSSGINFHCISVGPGGETTFTWDAGGTNAAVFGSWNIYYASSLTGPFSLIDSNLVYTDTIATHLTANAGVSPAYYYVTFRPNDGSPQIFSDTIRAIGLNLINPNNGYANLSWNATHYPPVATNNPYYLIYKEYPSGVFTLIDSIDVRTAPVPMMYNDPITVCDDTIRYRIEVRDSSGCISVSFTKGDRFFDRLTPAIPVIDSVSVDIFGNAIVSWVANPSNDTRSYVVLHYPSNTVVDTVTGINNTTLNTGIDATMGSQSFQVLAIDSCNNQTAPSPHHTSIYLAASFEYCSTSGILAWSPYNFWGAPPLYHIYVSVNGGLEYLVDTTSNTFYIDTNLVSGSGFCYRIQAVETAGVRTTTSNRSCIFPNFPPPPAFSYIRRVTVTGTDQIQIVVHVDPGAVIKGYELYRSLSATGPFSAVASVTVNGVATVVFNDNVSTETGPYFYYVSTFDSCGSSVFVSQVSQSVFLSGIAGAEFVNQLDWTPYAQWPLGVNRYNIYRVIDGVLVPVPLVTLTAADLSYLDEILGLYAEGGEFCYVIEAIETFGNPFGFLDSARSNEICLVQEPVIFIPNAFHPGGFLNETFRPSNGFVSPDDYMLYIFNRWGEIIFQTSDPQLGWDGVTNGKHAQEGVYVYLLKAKTPVGGDIERVGSVTLIR